LGVSGNASSITSALGSMYSGNCAPNCRRSSAAPICAPASAIQYPTSRLSPGTSSRASTTASRTPPHADSFASISPGSIRKPRIFTWKSLRPWNSSVPSSPQRPRSPVLYIRACGSALNRSRTNRSCVSSARFR
jgi:hypothetical protein